MDEDAPAACNGSGGAVGLALAAEKAKMNVQVKALLKLLLLAVVVFGVIVAAFTVPVAWELYRREYGPPCKTVPGTEEVCTGIVSDRAFGIVDWMLYDKAPFLAESRRYIGISFDDGGGSCFWIADVCEEPERANPGDRVRMETAEEKGTGLRVVTKITLLEKLSF